MMKRSWNEWLVQWFVFVMIRWASIVTKKLYDDRVEIVVGYYYLLIFFVVVNFFSLESKQFGGPSYFEWVKRREILKTID